LFELGEENGVAVGDRLVVQFTLDRRSRSR